MSADPADATPNVERPIASGPGVLYLVPVPIGNIDDVTRRALDVLRAVGIVAAEDTRSARLLFRRLGVVTSRVVSYHEHNERSRAPWLVERLRAGEDVALVPEAGMTVVSDPGFRLVRAAIEAGIVVRALPGGSAVLTALAASGLPPDRFSFVGFLPRQREKRRAALVELARRTDTLVVFEAPHRILVSLEDARTALGDRRAAIAVNMTKPDELVLRGTLSELVAEIDSWEHVRGEMTLVIEGAVATQEEIEPNLDDAINRLLGHELGPRAIRDALAPLVGVPKRTIYERAVELAQAQ